VQATVSSPQALAGELVELFHLIHRDWQSEWFKIVAELDVSPSQLKSLHLLEAKGEIQIKDLAKALPLSLPAASRAADALVQRGFIARRECTEDRRSRRIRLTGEGHAALARVIEARVEGFTQFLETLPEDQRAALQAALAPIVERTRP
jgi:DNA-binding MarR family transcriptional regulator